MSIDSSTPDTPRRRWRWLRSILTSWWLRSLYQAVVMIGAVAICVYVVGWAQRIGWIQVERLATTAGAAEATVRAASYICPMMCVPPTTEPGRCPVCAMELVPTTSDSDAEGDASITIPIADRRLVGITTVPVKRVAATRKITAVGLLAVDESRRVRIPVDASGRVEKLFFNYTGQRIHVGEKLATFYSPDLYAAQTELLTLKQTRGATSERRQFLADVRKEIIDAARQRLRELGMNSAQIQAIEQRGEPESRIDISSPQSGTITQLMLQEGQYVQEGEIVCEVADLSQIWLVTQLFPEDAALVRYGQRVSATIRSLPGRSLPGRVSFIAPVVDAKRSVVHVRVNVSNPDGQLRPGDEATVMIDVPLQPGQDVYDPQLAGKFICPEHPDETATFEAKCPRSGRAMVAATTFGFAASPDDVAQPLVIPRRAVLMAGQRSAVYVEVEEGAFELRRVTLGSRFGEDVVVVDGLEEHAVVAADGNFLIDSQMQLSGRPSLIDPSRVVARDAEESPFQIEVPEIGDIQIFDGTPGDDEPDSDAARGSDAAWLLPESGRIELWESPQGASASPAEAGSEHDAAEGGEGDWELPESGPPQPIEDGEPSVSPSGDMSVSPSVEMSVSQVASYRALVQRSEVGGWS